MHVILYFICNNKFQNIWARNVWQNLMKTYRKAHGSVTSFTVRNYSHFNNVPSTGDYCYLGRVILQLNDIKTYLRFHSALQSYCPHFIISPSAGRLLIWIRTEQVTNKNWTLSLMHYHLKQNYTSNNVWRHYKHVNSNNSCPHSHRTHHVAHRARNWSPTAF